MWNPTVALILVDSFIVVLLVLVAIEMWLTYKGFRPVGSHVWAYLDVHPWINVGLALFLGALIGHFFAKGPIPWQVPPWDWLR